MGFSKIAVIAIFCLVFTYSASAETLALRSDQAVEGKVLEKTDERERKEEVKTDIQSSSRTYFNKEYGISIIVPEGWFTISGDSKRAEMAKKVDEKRAQEPRNPIFSNPERIKANLLENIPIVTIYKFFPDLVKESEANPNISILVKDAEGREDPMENLNIMAGLVVLMPGAKVLERPHTVVRSGLTGGRYIIQEPKSVTLTELFIKNKKAYLIDCKAPVQSYNECLLDFEKALSGLSIN